MKIKRTLSIILAIIMVLSVCSVSAYAEGTHTSGTALGDLANWIYTAVTGDSTEVQPTSADHVCHYSTVAYVSKNAFQHYVQWKCSCGRVLMAYDEAHRIGWDLTCSLCGYGKGNGGNGTHTHAEDHRVCTPVDANNHRVDVYCKCGQIIDSFLEPHNFNDKGICTVCGYDKNGNGGGGNNNGGNGGNGGNNDNGDKDPVSGDWNGHRYTIIYDTVSWKTAKALCENVGAHLVTITSKEEQEFINSLNEDEDNLWIGAFFKSGAWKWVTDEAWDYTNWAASNPSNSETKSCSAVFPQLWINLKYNNLTKLDGYILECDTITIVK